jgi:hypothetical protein
MKTVTAMNMNVVVGPVKGECKIAITSICITWKYHMKRHRIHFAQSSPSSEEFLIMIVSPSG